MIEGILQLLLIALGISAVSLREDSISFWNREETNAVKGYFCLLIILFHIPVSSVWYNLLGSVSFFFIVFMYSFFSSYGICFCLRDNCGYHNKLPKKIVHIAIAYVVSCILKFFVSNDPFSGGVLWINTLLISYTVAYISYCVFGKYYNYVIICFWILYSMGVHYFEIPYLGWAEQSLGYSFGALFAEGKDELWNKIRNANRIKKIVLLGISFFCCLAFGYKYLQIHTVDKISDEMFFLRIILSCFGLNILLLFSTKFKLSSHFLAFLGKLCLWMFLWHGLFIYIFRNIFSDGLLYIAVLIATILISVISYKCEKYIVAMARK